MEQAISVDTYSGPFEATVLPSWAGHMLSWVFRTVWDNTMLEVPTSCLQCATKLYRNYLMNSQTVVPQTHDIMGKHLLH